MKRRLLSFVKRFAPLVIGVAVLVYLFGWATDPEETLRTARRVKPATLAFALGLCGLSFLAAAFRLQMLVRLLGCKLGLWRSLVYTLIGQFYSTAIPGGTVGGDAVKALYLSRHTEHRAHAFACVLVDRICGLFALATTALVMLIPSIGDETMFHAALVAMGFMGAGSVAVILMLSRRVRRIWPDWVRTRIPFRDAIVAFDSAVQVFRGRRAGLLLVVLVSALPQLGWIGMHVAIGEGLGIDAIGWTDYLVLVPVSGMVAALPISFGGWGVGEAAAIFFFRQRGVPEASALVLSTLGRLAQLVWALVGLPLSWALPRPKEMDAAMAMEPTLADPKLEEALAPALVEASSAPAER